MKQPITVNAAWASINVQSTLRLGAAGLERMLPRPESGLRRTRSVGKSVGVGGR